MISEQLFSVTEKPPSCPQRVPCGRGAVRGGPARRGSLCFGRTVFAGGVSGSAGASDVLSSGQNVSTALTSHKRGGVTAGTVAENLCLCGLVLLGGMHI